MERLEDPTIDPQEKKATGKKKKKSKDKARRSISRRERVGHAHIAPTPRQAPAVGTTTHFNHPRHPRPQLPTQTQPPTPQAPVLGPTLPPADLIPRRNNTFSLAEVI